MKPYCTIRCGKHVLFGNGTVAKFSECKLCWFHLNFITYSLIKQSLDIDVFCQKLASYELLTTQVARVKAEYANQLDYMGYQKYGTKKSDNETIVDYYVWQTCSSCKLARRSLSMITILDCYVWQTCSSWKLHRSPSFHNAKYDDFTRKA